MLNAKDVARRRPSKTEPGADRGRRNVVRRCVNTSLRKRGRGRGALTWGGRGSNPRPTDYESVPSAETGFDGVSWCVPLNAGNPNGHNGINRRKVPRIDEGRRESCGLCADWRRGRTAGSHAGRGGGAFVKGDGRHPYG